MILPPDQEHALQLLYDLPLTVQNITAGAFGITPATIAALESAGYVEREWVPDVCGPLLMLRVTALGLDALATSPPRWT